ncbi:MAG: type II toxin-antitoxin system VapB family antitoxin [Rubrivivax sp.]|nr:type II toxin-antitoxin system VapB family antitoxin [Rubrivivax sp.]
MSTSAVFTNNRSQAVRLPADARLPPHVKRVEVRVRGAERIISPAGHTWDSFFAADAPRVSDDFLPQRATQDQIPREAL